MNSLAKERIAVIGSGTMAGAIVGALLSNQEIDQDRITASDPYPEQRELFNSRYGVNVTDNNLQAIKDADIIILSVKPQVLPEVMSGIKSKIPSRSLVFSIVAGMPISTIQKGLSHKAVIRCMPNTPAQISAGMTTTPGSRNEP